VLTRPDRPAFYAQPAGTNAGPDEPCVPRVAISPPPSFPPRLAATQLALACGWCHLIHGGLSPPSALACRADTGKPATLLWPACPFGDEVVAVAMIDRLVHHAEVVALKGDPYRLKNRDLGRVPADTAESE
jgi:IstB-like ATP binding protein